MENENVLSSKVIAGGWNYSRIVKRGQKIRLTDLEGGANASLLCYNAKNFTERFNLGDTLKIQHICRIAEKCCLYGDMGRILLSVVKDTVGWHDPLCGCTHANLVKERFGAHDYQHFRNDFYRNGYDSLLVEIGKYGMTKRDFTELVNFFSKVVVTSDGKMTFVENNSKAGDFVELRAEMDTLVVIDTGMHPLNPSKEYLRKPVKVELLPCAISTADDPCFTWCPENARGFANTLDYNL